MKMKMNQTNTRFALLALGSFSLAACNGSAPVSSSGQAVKGVVDATGICVCTEQEPDGRGECVDGFDSKTGQPCADGDSKSDGDGECEDGVDSATGQPCSESDGAPGGGECVDGFDSKTGQPCAHDDSESDGDGECEDGVDSATGQPCTESGPADAKELKEGDACECGQGSGAEG
jgi:predicted small secreted protein